MTEIKDCLPDHARAHFIDLRNIHLEAETKRYQSRLAEFRAKLSVKGHLNSGYAVMEQWKYTEEFHANLASGYVEAAFKTCQLYDIPVTESICNCVVRAVEELLEIQYQHALRAHAQGLGDAKIPLSVAQQGNTRRIMPKIRVMVETARVGDERRRREMAEEKERSGDTYTQTIVQHSGVINASQTGDVATQQVSVGQLSDLCSAIAEMRAFFKKQEESVDADQYIGLLASAEKAAGEKDESKMRGYLKQIPSKAWDIGKAVIPKVLLHYLKLHGLA